MRYPFQLRRVPPRARLVLETPVAVEVYLNGAPLLRRLTGKRVLDVSRVLHSGLNDLALHWTRVEASAQISPAPLLRYEWLF